MDLLVSWVTQIIIFLMLAAIVDLLIPTTNMKKYIKLVIGLILILIFLKPLFYLFTIDIEREIESSFSDLYEEVDGNSLENLIKVQETEIQASTDAYILKQMVSQLKLIAETPLLNQYQVEIESIDFMFSPATISYENLEEIIVSIRDQKDQKGVVSNVEEIEINMDNLPVEKQNYHSDEQIKETLLELWELHDKGLTVKRGEGRFEG